MSGKSDKPVTMSPGYGFHLQQDGQWKVEPVPNDVVKAAEFSGYLTIHGYKSTVFDMPNGDSWAQKSVNTPVVSSLAKRVAARWIKSQVDVVTQLKEGLDKDDMSAWNKAAQEYVGKVKEYLPDLDKVHKSAVGELEKAINKVPKASHPRVDGYEAQELQSVFQQYLEAVRKAKQDFDSNIMEVIQKFINKEESEEE